MLSRPLASVLSLAGFSLSLAVFLTLFATVLGGAAYILLALPRSLWMLVGLNLTSIPLYLLFGVVMTLFALLLDLLSHILTSFTFFLLFACTGSVVGGLIPYLFASDHPVSTPGPALYSFHGPGFVGGVVSGALSSLLVAALWRAKRPPAPPRVRTDQH
jgi:hypothetical protein